MANWRAKHHGHKLHSTLRANQHTPHQKKEGLRHVLVRLYITQRSHVMWNAIALTNVT